MNGTSRSNRFSSLMNQYLNVVLEGVAECACECPFCGGKSSLQFNDEKGLWICFKCQEGGTAKKLVKLLQGTYTEPEVEIEHIRAQLQSLGRDFTDPEKPVSDSYLARFRHPGGPSSHWIDRGFDTATCERWELGYDFLNDRLTLPYRDPASGNLSGIIFRALGVVDGPRYKFPFGFSRNSALYGSWLVGAVSKIRGPADEAVISEGPTDAISTSQAEAQGLCQYGSSISVGQIRLLHRLGVRRIVMFYDYDRAGLRATEKSARILPEQFQVERVVYDRDAYCWHEYMCGCVEGEENHDVAVEHTSSGRCDRPRKCKCGRIHEPDPGSLDTKTIDEMLGKRVRV